MKWLLGTYTNRFNRRHKLAGHLFSGRYKALVVDGSGYLKSVGGWALLDLDPVPCQAPVAIGGTPLAIAITLLALAMAVWQMTMTRLQMVRPLLQLASALLGSAGSFPQSILDPFQLRDRPVQLDLRDQRHQHRPSSRLAHLRQSASSAGKIPSAGQFAGTRSTKLWSSSAVGALIFAV